MIMDGIRWALRRSHRRADTQFLRSAMAAVDAILASYPKSGRTWLRFALSCYFDEVGGLGLSPDLTTTFRILPNLDRDPLRGLPGFAFTDNPAVPLIAVTHLPYDRDLFGNRPVIFLLRDPRDVVVSAYFHATRHKNRYHGTLKSFIGDPRQGLPALVGYLNEWAEHLDRHRHHVVSYEAMSADLADVIRNILSFLRLPCDEDAVCRAVEMSGFESMRKSEQEVGIPGHKYDRTDDESLRMRKGKAGGFVDYLDDEDIVLIESACAEGLNAKARKMVAITGLSLGESIAGQMQRRIPGPAAQLSHF